MTDVPAPYVPARVRLRDVLLSAIPAALLAALMRFHGDVVRPRGDDPLHPLGHYASLLHSGHVPGGVLIGTVLTFLLALGILGLLGDSPLDVRGDEVARDAVEARPWYRHEGAWLVGFCVLLYVPLAGAFGLWDPWETHYSEVAREVLARDDWITLWWGQEGWFMSKPILIFWMSALGMGVGSAFGVPFWRDMGPGSHEWFIRLPIVFFAIGAVYSLYKCVAIAWGRRAGLLSGLVLATMPHWFFLSHQAMTDMPFVAPLVICMVFLILAAIADPAAVVTPRVVRLFGRSFRISTWHLAMGAIIVVAAPQIVYLLTRPVLVACSDDAHASCREVLNASRIGPIQFPIEQYWSGSAGNSMPNDRAASVPGSPAWEDRYNQIAFAPSFVQGIIWLIVGVALLWSFRKERRVQVLRFTMQYLFSAISFMGKGPAGVGVPEVVLLGFMLTAGKWSLLPRVRLFQGAGTFLLCGMPWYIAIYCRLGHEFFDRFVVHDLINRTFAGVHGDTGTFRYFVWQLGYAMFPWTGLVPTALVGWKLFVPESATEAQRDVTRLALLWFLVAFTLFSLMVTKFHHYIFPTVPSCALLVGLVLHRMLGARRLAHTGRSIGAVASLAIGTGALVFGLGNLFGRWSGRVPEGASAVPPGSPAFVALGIAAGVALLALAWTLVRSSEVEDVLVEPSSVPYRSAEGPLENSVEEARAAHEPALEVYRGADYRRFVGPGLGAAALGSVVTLALLTRDIGFVSASPPPGYERFIHLFVYNYERQWPTHSLDFHANTTAFGLVALVAASLMVAEATRRFGVRMMIAVAACFGFWALDSYMIKLSDHWSQRNLFEAYQARRHVRESVGTGEDERYTSDAMVAFQMNWKGENFYTGNHAVMLECGLPFCNDTKTPDWLRAHHGQHVFFVTEHSRAGSIINQVEQAHGHAQRVTTERDNNKFILVEGQL